MNDQFEQCINEGHVIKIERDPELIAFELKEGEDDLDASEESASQGNFKWTIIQGHYSMEHSFRALLFSKGYSAKGHPCLKSGIQTFFIDHGLLDENCLKDFDYSHKVYEGEEHVYNHKEDFALYILNAAGEVYEAAKKLTRNK